MPIPDWLDLDPDPSSRADKHHAYIDETGPTDTYRWHPAHYGTCVDYEEGRRGFVGTQAAAAHIDRLTQAVGHGHVYLSTACWHAEHDRRPELHAYCQGSTREDGSTKRPAICKWCDAQCTCHCHTTQTG